LIVRVDGLKRPETLMALPTQHQGAEQRPCARCGTEVWIRAGYAPAESRVGVQAIIGCIHPESPDRWQLAIAIGAGHVRVSIPNFVRCGICVRHLKPALVVSFLRECFPTLIGDHKITPFYHRPGVERLMTPPGYMNVELQFTRDMPRYRG
jgi:hypothetical protein